MHIVLSIVQVVVALAIIFVILMQSGKSAGLSGSIAGGAETFFGKKKGLDDFLSKVTVWLAVVFFAVSLVFAMVI